MQLLCLGDVKVSHGQGPLPFWTLPIDFQPGAGTRLLLDWEIGHPVEPISNPVASVPAIFLRKWSPGVAALANGCNLEACEKDLTDDLLSLQQAGFKTLGAGRTAEDAAAPLLWETAEGGLTILNWVFPKAPLEETQPGVNCWPGLMDAGETIRSVKRTSDWVLVILHWNDSPFLHPHPEHREIARQIAAFGADAVIGGYPHGVRGMEFMGNCPVFYGLGTFFSPADKENRQQADPARPPRSRASLAIRFSFQHGKPLEYELFSFWNNGRASRLDALEHAFRRMNSASRILYENTGETYLDWYEMERIRLERRENVFSHWPLGRELGRSLLRWVLRVKSL